MTTTAVAQVFCAERLRQFVKFCVVGGSGVFVDMGVLFLLADPRGLGWNVTLSKICSAEAAMTSNFIWNELWTFRNSSLAHRMGEGLRARNPALTLQRFNEHSVLRRFLLFHAICGIGIGLAVLLLHLFHRWLGWNLYVSNLLAIIAVTFWNFDMNNRFNWNK